MSSAGSLSMGAQDTVVGALETMWHVSLELERQAAHNLDAIRSIVSDDPKALMRALVRAAAHAMIPEPRMLYRAIAHSGAKDCLAVVGPTLGEPPGTFVYDLVDANQPLLLHHTLCRWPQLPLSPALLERATELGDSRCIEVLLCVALARGLDGASLLGRDLLDEAIATAQPRCVIRTMLDMGCTVSGRALRRAARIYEDALVSRLARAVRPGPDTTAPGTWHPDPSGLGGDDEDDEDDESNGSGGILL